MAFHPITHDVVARCEGAIYFLRAESPKGKDWLKEMPRRGPKGQVFGIDVDDGAVALSAENMLQAMIVAAVMKIRIRRIEQ